jgi:hypothetical protein
MIEHVNTLNHLGCMAPIEVGKIWSQNKKIIDFVGLSDIP